MAPLTSAISIPGDIVFRRTRLEYYALRLTLFTPSVMAILTLVFSAVWRSRSLVKFRQGKTSFTYCAYLTPHNAFIRRGMINHCRSLETERLWRKVSPFVVNSTVLSATSEIIQITPTFLPSCSSLVLPWFSVFPLCQLDENCNGDIERVFRSAFLGAKPTGIWGKW